MKWAEAEEQRAGPSPLCRPFLLLCLLHFLSVNEAQSSAEHKNWDLSSYHGLGFFRPAQHSGCSLILQASVTPSVSPSGWILTFFLHLCSFLFFSSYSCRNSPFLILLLCFSLCLSTAMTKGTTNRSDFTLCFTIHHYQSCAHLLGMFFRKLSAENLAAWDFPWMMHYICCYTGLTVALEISNRRNVPLVG